MSTEAVAPPVEETWNLADLFADDTCFDDAKRELRQSLEVFESFQGRLLSSATVLADALEAIDRTSDRLQLLHCYAAMSSDVDTRRADRQAKRQEIQLLSTEFAQRVAFVRPEIVAGEPELIRRYIDEEPRLVPHEHPLHDLMRQRRHILGPDEERIMAHSGLIRREASSTYSILTNAELPRPEITLGDGQRVKLTQAGFAKHRTTRERSDRLAIFPKFFGAYADFSETLGQNLYSGIKSHLFRARARRYDSCLAAATDADNIPECVYRNLIEQVHRRLPLLHRYFRLRAQALGLEKLEYPDLYCPLGDAPARRYSVDDAKRTVLDGLGLLGDEYRAVLESAFGSRWIDWHPTAGKRSGAYANGWAYSVHPYVLLNFNEDHESVMTLAHEVGHAMHSYHSNRQQPFPTADYSIFVAEVASTFNEELLRRRMFENATSAEERLYLLGSYLDGIRGTLFRQTMFAEFELEIHERAERGEALTGERLSEIYRRLLHLYHGHDAGVVHVADEYAIEWAAIPHMYYDFYVYQYATGIVAATALARGVVERREQALERYLAFLGSGGSDYPLALLRAAGVDLEQAAPYDAAFDTVEEHLDELERCLASTTGAAPGS